MTDTPAHEKNPFEGQSLKQLEDVQQDLNHKLRNIREKKKLVKRAMSKLIREDRHQRLIGQKDDPRTQGIGLE